MTQNEFFEEVKLKLKDGAPLSDIFSLQESRYAGDDSLINIKSSMLGNIYAYSGNVIVNSEQTEAYVTFKTRFANSDLKNIASWLDLEDSIATGILKAPGDDGYPIFEFTVQGELSYEELFDPLPVQVENFGLQLVSHIQDEYSDNILSTCILQAEALVEGIENSIFIRSQVIQSKEHLNFSVELEPELSIKDGTTFIMNFFGVKEELSLPAIFDIAGIKSFTFQIKNPFSTGTLKTSGLLESAGLVLSTKEAFKPSAPLIQLNNITTTWNISIIRSEDNQTKDYVIQGTLLGEYALGNVTDPIANLYTSLEIPSFEVEIGLQEGTSIQLGDLMKEYLKIPKDSLPNLMTVTKLKGNASVMTKEFCLDMEITDLWEFNLGNVTLSLDSISAYLGYFNNQMAGSFEGYMTVGNEDQSAVLQLTAEYDKPIWQLSGGIESGSLNVPALIVGFTGTTPPEWLNKIKVEIKKLWIDFSTEQGHPFHITGEIEAGWNIDILGKQFSIGASIDYTRKKKTPNQNTYAYLSTVSNYEYQGYITGNVKIGFFMVKVGTRFSNSSSPLYDFYISYQNIYLQASTFLITNKNLTKHQAIKIKLGGATFGEILEYFYHLINPNLDMKLPSPWNVLNDIKLSDFEFILDPTLKQYKVQYLANLNIGIATIQSLGLCIDSMSAGSKLKVILTGNILGKKYSDEKPLEWDTVNGNAPQAPGTGRTLFTLYYIGMGQFIKPTTDMSQIKSIKAILDLWKKALPAGTEGFQNPVKKQSNLLQFDENVNWMVGIDMAVLDFIRFRILFQDPDIYGAQLTLNGAQAGSLSGLNLEILYKKIRDNIGMFKTRLMLPEAFRHFEFGIFSVTLGMIDVEIYTNGNFMIDFGFPHGGDFTNSFNIQAAWWTGDGGVYFGVLSSETTNLVPKISNGRFSPVIAFGIGFRFGIGRSFHTGILNAEAAVQLMAILEGVFAVYQPTDKAKQKDYYYRVKGTIGIVGRVYAEINFSIIQVCLSLEVKAMASILVEAYEKILVSLALSILAKASIKILFIRISFEFRCNLKLDFSFGEKRLAPWQTGDSSLVDHKQLMSGRLMTTLKNKHQNLVQSRNMYTWNPDILLFEGEKRSVFADVVPIFSIDQVEVTRDNQSSYQVAFLFFINQSVTTTENDNNNSFQSLLETITRWSLSAAKGSDFNGYIDLGEIEELKEWFETEEAKGGFKEGVLSYLFAHNMIFYLSHMPLIVMDETDQIESDNGVFLPVFPELTFTYAMNGVEAIRDFKTYQPVSEAYEDELALYFEKLKHLARERKQNNINVLEENVTSYASMIYSDYYYNLARSSIQMLTQCMDEYHIDIDEKKSLRELVQREEYTTVVVNEMIAVDDTISSIAHRLGTFEDGLRYYNPDIDTRIADSIRNNITNMDVTIGVTPQAIAIANEDLILTPDIQYILSDYPYTIGLDDTLKSIADSYDIPIAELIDAQIEEHILRPDAQINVVQNRYQDNHNRSMNQIAAVFYERYYHPDNECLSWFISRISELNAKPDVSDDIILYPVTFGQLEPTAEWTKLPGDTIFTVASYCAILAQPSNEFQAFKEQVTLIGDSLYQIPDAMIKIGVEIPSLLKTRLLCSDSIFTDIIQDAKVLMPYITITLPEVKVQTGSNETLAQFSTRMGMTVEKITSYLLDEKNLFNLPVGNSIAMTIPSVPKIKILTLIEQLKTEYADNIAGQVSRFFLQGLRLPGPGSLEDSPSTTLLGGMYEWIGQQFAVNITDETPEDNAIQLTIEKDVNTEWIQYVGTSVTKYQLKDSIRYRHDVIYESSVHNELNKEENQEMDHIEDEGDVSNNQSLVKENTFVNEDTFVNEGTLVKKEFYLRGEQETILEISYKKSEVLAQLPGTVLNLDFVEPLAAMSPSKEVNKLITLGNPSKILGSNVCLRSLEEVSSSIVDGTSCRLINYKKNNSVTKDNIGEGSLTHGLFVPLSILKTNTAKTYELYGVKEVDREALLSYSQLTTDTQVSIELYYRANIADRTDAGFCKLKKNSSSTFLLKANLSTETKSTNMISNQLIHGKDRADRFVSTYFSDSSDVKGFLKLIWECTTIGGGGFWLHLPEELPDNIFSDTGNGTVWIFVRRKDNILYPWDNYVLVDTINDYALECTQIKENQSCLNTGEWGFDMTLRSFDPDTLDLINSDNRLRQLFHIVMYQLIANDNYEGSGLSLPVFPVEKENEWWYGQVIPLYRFFKTRYNATPKLPDPMEDPYVGVNGSDGITTVKASVNFYDILGNSTKSNSDLQIDASTYYTTPITSPVQLPHVNSTFFVQEGKVITTLCPDSLGIFGYSMEKDKLQKYQDAYYQYQQDDIQISLYGSLAKDAMIELKEPMKDMISAIWLCANLRNECPAYEAHEDTIHAYYERYAISANQFANACGSKKLYEIFASMVDVVIPSLIIIQSSESLRDVFDDDEISYNIQDIMSKEENVSIPFISGIYIKTSIQEITCVNTSFLYVSNTYKTSIESLVELNQDSLDIFAIGSVFSYEKDEVVVDTVGMSLNAICQIFEEVYSRTVSPYDLIVSNKESNLIRQGAILYYDDCLSDGLSFLSYETEAKIKEAIQLNLDVKDLYPAGTLLFIQNRNVPMYDLYNQYTIEEVAKIVGCSNDKLLSYNEYATITPDFMIPIEGLITRPEDINETYQPYYASGQSLNDIANLMNMDVLELANDNRERKVMYGDGEIIIIDDEEVVCPKGAYSLDQLSQLFSEAITFSRIVGVIADDSTLIRDDSMWVVRYQSFLIKPDTISSIAELAHVSAISFIEANATLCGILKTGETIITRDSNNEIVTQVIQVNDTFHTILNRFKAQGIHTSYEIITELNNSSHIIVPDAWYFLPPKEIIMEQDLQNQPIDEPLWPITMTMKIERELTKVHNDFRQTPNFVSMESLIPPYHETEEDGKVSYVKLASGIEAELPYVRVVVGRRNEDRKENIYALQCLDTGVKSVRVTAPVTIEWNGINHQAPRYYAIRPLSNQLISRDQVSIYSYSEGKLTDESLTQNFNNIDMDIWARWFLKDYETLLRSDYYTAIYESNTSHETFDKIIQCKLSLAEAIATGVDLVFRDITTENDEPLLKAISKVEQLLRSNLFEGYAVDAIAQYDVNCESMWSEWAPRLEGIVKKDNTVNKDDTVSNEAKTVSFQGEPITLQNGLSYTHIVLKTNHPEFQKRIPLDQVQYLVQQLEWDRSLVSVEKTLVGEMNSAFNNIMSELSSEELEDSLLYENSSWLKFVLPFRTDDTITLGYETDIPAPVPLRWFPAVPEIRYHRTKKSNESPEHYENALQWDYLFSYRHEHFEQDSIHVMIEWNIDPKLMLAKSVDLFHALAQYTTIRDDLSKDMEGFLSDSNNTVSNNALETFLTLAEDIKDNWMNHFSMTHVRSELIQNRIYEYVVQRITKTNPDDINQIYLDKMYVTRNDNQSAWPELQIELESSGEKITLRKGEEEGNDNGAFYFCDDSVEASDKITINLIYKELDINAYQNAKGSVYVKRNDDIMKDYGIALNEAFIYETGKAETPSVVTPFLSYDKTYSVGKLFDRDTYSYEDSQLPVVLSKLTGGSNDIGISMEIRYGLKIANVDQKPLYSYIPAYYMPSTFLDSIDTDSIINACINWWQNNNLMNKEGIWQYDVTIYSKFEDKLPLCSLLLEFTN